MSLYAFAGMAGEPSHAVIRETLFAIKRKPEVQDVLIALDPEADEEMWPVSDTVYVLAKTDEEQIRKWVAAIKPDELSEGYAATPPARAPQPEPGVRVWRVWWD